MQRMTPVTVVNRTMIGGALALLLALGALLLHTPAATQAQSSGPTIGAIQTNPAAEYDQIVTLHGTLERYVDDNEFLLTDGTGSIVVDAGPPWYVFVDVSTGMSVTVTGQIDLLEHGSADLDACRIGAPGGTIAIRDCSVAEPPPWAGGPNRGERGDNDERGPDDDDFYGIIDSRPAGPAGTWVISGRSFTATTETELDDDDGSLVVGACVAVDFENTTAEEIEREERYACSTGDTQTTAYGIVETIPTNPQDAERGGE